MIKEKIKNNNFLEWFLAIIIIVFIHIEFISIADGILIYSVIIGLEYILNELQEIKKSIQRLNMPPFHINCRHQIKSDIGDEE